MFSTQQYFNAILTDTSVKEFLFDLITHLEEENSKLSIQAMSEYTIFLQGKKEMLEEIITKLKNEYNSKK